MAETSPPPTAGAESCSEEPARGGKQRPEEPRRAPAGGADREDEAGPPLASPAGQSEPGSPVAAPFFLLYPGDGGAGFVARPPPQQQRSWRTPPSPGSPLPFLLLNYPSGGGGGGKHREWRRGREMPAGKGGLGREGPLRLRGAPPPAGSPERSGAPGQRGGRGAGGCSPEARVPGCRGGGGEGDGRGPGAGLFTSESPQASGSRPASPPLPSRAGRSSLPASHVLADRSPGFRVGVVPGGVKEGAAPGTWAAGQVSRVRAPSAAAAE